MKHVSDLLDRSDVGRYGKECRASSGCAGESLTRAEQDVDWGDGRVGRTAMKLSLVGWYPLGSPDWAEHRVQAALKADSRT